MVTSHDRIPNPLRKALTRQKLLDGALSAFSRVGYHDASVDEIVTEAGASKGAFYFHFPSKGALFVTLMDTLANRIAADVDRAVAAETTTIGRVDAAVGSVIDVFTRHRTIARVFLVDVPTHNAAFDAKLRQIHARFARLIQQHLDEAVADGSAAPIDTVVLSRMWLGAITESVTAWLAEPASSAPSAEALRGTLRAGLLRTLYPHPGEA